ncbi:hypothetical protein FRC11_007392, partial [Ceratobasidium sp. 423]
ISAKNAQRIISSYQAPITPPSSPHSSGVSTEEKDKPVIVIDLREVGSTPVIQAPNVLHFPVCSPSSLNPFTDPAALAAQWKLMDAKLGIAETGALGKDLKGKTVILVCYEGHTASVAASVLRNRQVEAYWVDGGIQAWSGSGKC